MSEKRYTAQEMRERADNIDPRKNETESKTLLRVMANVSKVLGSSQVSDTDALEHAANMLRQAADDAEELAQLKARLEAVVKECENCFMRVELFRVKMISVADITRRHNADINDILRAARGEGGAE